MADETPVLAIVSPCFNEADCIVDSLDKLIAKRREMVASGDVSAESYILVVDDGSYDGSWNLVMEKSKVCAEVRALRLSRNFGHQSALLAGLVRAAEDCDCVITIDIDLQQDIRKISDFIAHFKNGSHIVFGVRNNRATESGFKKFSVSLYYFILKLCRVKTIEGHSDYRLLSKRALLALLEYSEINLYLRGILPTIGFRTSVVFHDVFPRKAGTSKYTIRKMTSLAINGITSFSILPLRVISILGIGVFIMSVFMALFVLYSYIKGGTVQGWASSVLPIYFLGGLQILCIGIIGEYVGKIYLEAKRRPRYIIQEESHGK
jgi:glycosyltransferase involved in cell wall biosynthesis